jgi:cell division protein FtsN
MTHPTASRTEPAKRRATGARHGSRGGTLVGVFIGLVLGLMLAAGVAYYLMRSSMPFQSATTGKDARDPARETAKTARSDHGEGASEKPRFDFYKILPGGEEPKAQPERKPADRPDRAVAGEAKERSGEKAGATKAPERPAEPVATPAPERKAATVANAETGAAGKMPVKTGERFWLQAGAFVNETEAENLKARLALAGWEAAVQPAPTADKGVRFRVRLGPYDNTEELARVKSDLGKRGFDVAVIKF